VNDEITFSLVNITGPGVLSMYTTSPAPLNNAVGGAPSLLLTSSDPQANRNFLWGAQLHGDISFGFSTPGIYTVEFQASGNRIAGGGTTSDLYEFQFEVVGVPEPTTYALMATAVAGLAGYTWRRRRQQQRELSRNLSASV
jgi:surface-anchored protein